MRPAIISLLSPPHQPTWRWVLLALLVVVAWFAFSPATGVDVFEHFDKVKHVLAFVCLATVASLGWTATSAVRARIVWSLLLYGVFIEAVQSTIPGRSASWLDLVADAVGVAGGMVAAGLARRRLDRPES